MKTKKGLRRVSVGVFTLWVAAIAVAPLWHGEHGTRPAGDRPLPHQHDAGTFLCDFSGPNLTPRGDCVLCASVRLLEQGLSRAIGTGVVPLTAGVIHSVRSFETMRGWRLLPGARAPPLL